MSKYALVHEGIVVNILQEKPDGRFFEPGLNWVEIPDSTIVEEGYRYDQTKNEFFRVRLDLNTEKQLLLKKVNEHTDMIHDHIFAAFPKSETASFYRQELEVERWTRGDNRVPFLTVIANKRKLPIEELVKRVAMKAEYIAPIIAVPIADRQYFEDEIMACQTHEQLDGVTISVIKWMKGES